MLTSIDPMEFEEDFDKLHEIIFKDGTKIEAKLNGNSYIYDGDIDDDLVSFDNTLEITIDGEKFENQICQKFKVKGDDATRLVFSDASPQYIENIGLKSQIEYLAMMADIDL